MCAPSPTRIQSPAEEEVQKAENQVELRPAQEAGRAAAACSPEGLNTANGDLCQMDREGSNCPVRWLSCFFFLFCPHTKRGYNCSVVTAFHVVTGLKELICLYVHFKPIHSELTLKLSFS